MEQFYSDLHYKGTTLETDKSSRMPERPKTKIAEDMGSDFAQSHTRRKPVGSRNSMRGAATRKGGKVSKDLLDDEGSESADEIDFLSQSSRDRSRSPSDATRPYKPTSPESEPEGAVVLVDGIYHRYHPDYPPKAKPLPSFRKKKKVEEPEKPPASTEQSTSRTGKESTPSVAMRAQAERIPPRPTHKVLGMRPIRGRSTAASTQRYSTRSNDVEKTPKPNRSAPKPRPRGVPRTPAEQSPPLRPSNSNDGALSKRKDKTKAQEFPMEDVSPLKDTGSSRRSAVDKGKNKAKPQEFPMELLLPPKDAVSDSDSDRMLKSKNKATPQDFPLEVSPLKEKGNVAPKMTAQPFPMFSPLLSQTSSHSEPLNSPTHLELDPFPAISPLSSPISAKEGSQQETGNTRRLRSQNGGGVQKGRVVSSSGNSEASEDDVLPVVKKKHKLKPFPMAMQDLKGVDLSPSPGKRLSLDEYTVNDRDRKRVKGAEEMLVELMSTVEGDDDDLFLQDPNIDPSTLCPWCDERLPPAPSPHLDSLMAAARKRSSFDARPTNPLGLYAPPAVFISICQRHRFESVQIPLAEKRGWPTIIDWASLADRVRALERTLREIVHDVDEDFIPGRERPDQKGSDEQDANKDAVDDYQLLETRPRKGSAFWREVVKGVRNKGSRQESGIRGQMSSFSKTQPGYYGELGYVIINQTIYDLFPPTGFEPNATLPLTPTEFIQRVLVPEAAVSLVMEDLQETRGNAIMTLRDSASYGVAMFPDDHADGTYLTAGEQIVQKRAAARRQELEKEEREEEDMWAALSEPPSGSEQQGTRKTKRATSKAPSSRSNRPQRQCTSRTYREDSSSDESDAMVVSDDVEYAPSRTKKARGTRARAAPGASRKRTVKASDSESTDLAEISNPARSSQPRPRPRPRPARPQRATDTEGEGSGAEVCPPSSLRSEAPEDRFRGVDVGVDTEATPKAKRTKVVVRPASATSSTVFPLQLVRERNSNQTSTGFGGNSRNRDNHWTHSLRENLSEDDDF